MKTLITILILTIGFQAISQEEAEKIPKTDFGGYIKYMQTGFFIGSQDYWTTDNLVHNRLNFKWYMTDKLTFKAEARSRLFWGDYLKADTLGLYKASINTETGYFDLTDNIISEKFYFLNSTLDRLSFQYSGDKLDVKVGRQRINWGQTFAWNPNDIFNAYSFFDFDYEEKPGSDAVRVQYYTGVSSRIDLAFKVNSDEKFTYAALYGFNKWNWDFQVLGGVLNCRDYVVGGGWSGQLFKGGFRGEASYFTPNKEGRGESNFLASIGYDYTFKNSTMVQVEALYNDKGKTSGDFNLNELYTQELSAKNLSLTQVTFMAMVSKTINPLLNASVSAMYSPNDNSIYVGPTIAYSLTDNLDLSIVAQIFSSEQSAAMGGKGTLAFFRLKGSF